MIAMQKQSARYLVLSPYAQASYGTPVAAAKMTRPVQFDASSVLEKTIALRSDQKDVGKGTEFATNGQPTDYDTKMPLKKEAEAWFLGWVMAFLFGQSTDTGAGPYRHAFTFPNINATLVPTSLFVQETGAVEYTAADMCVASLSLSIGSRGAIMASVELMGTGLWTPGALAGGIPALPALGPADYLLASDMQLTITPTGGAATPFTGRLRSANIKLDNSAAPFKSAGDGFVAGSVNSGTRKFSLEMQVAALAADDVNGWFENQTRLAITLASKNTLTNQIGFSIPAAAVKANKLGNDGDLVVWGLSLDETSCYQVGGVPAISAYVINGQASYLMV